MKKVFVVLLKTFSVILVSAVVVLILLSLSLQIPYVQNAAIDQVAEWLTKKTGAKFSIEKINIGFVNSMSVDGVYIEDYSEDTMIFVKSIEASFKGIKPSDGKLRLGDISISGAKFKIVKDENGKTNIANVFSKLKNPERKTEILASSDRLKIDSSSLSIEGIVNADNISVDIADIDLDRKRYNADVRDIALYDRNRDLTLHISQLSDIKFDSTEASVSKAAISLGNSTLLLESFRLKYDSIAAIRKGTLQGEILKGTEISFGTINSFLRKKKNDIALNIFLNGYLSGKVDDFSGHLAVSSEDNTAEATFSVKGITDIKTSEFNIDVDRIQTSPGSISKLLKACGSKELPQSTERLGEIKVSGKFHGGVKAFDADALIMTGCGNISIAGKVHPTDSTIDLDGMLDILDFNLGRAIGNAKTGTMNLRGSVNASHKNTGGMDVNGNVTLESLEYGGYTFHDIVIDGQLNQKRFKGVVTCASDSNVMFHADGIYDFSSLPAFNFAMNMDNLDLSATGLNKRDSVSKVKSIIKARFSGNDIDNINGEVAVNSAFYINHLDTVNIGDFRLTATNNDENKSIEFKSKFADASFTGKNSYRNLIPYFKELTKTYIPSFDQVNKIVSSYEDKKEKADLPTVERVYDDGFYNFRLTAKESSKILSILVPGLEISRGSRVNFYFNPRRNRFNLDVRSEALTKGKVLVEALNIESHNNKDSLFLECSAEMINFGKFHLANAGLSSYLHDNHIGLKTYFNDSNNMADLGMKADIRQDRKIHMQILPSRFKIDSSSWDISNRKIVIDSSSIFVDTISIRNGTQNITAAGYCGKTMADTLAVVISNLDLSPVTFFIRDLGYDFSGIGNGHAELISAMKDKILKGHIDISNVHLLGDYLGDCSVSSEYDKENNRLMLELSLDDGSKPAVGFYSLSNRILDLQTEFPTFRLKYLAPVFKGTLTNITGTANSKIHFQLIKGRIPVLNGQAEVEDFATTIATTQVRYKVKGHIDLKDNYISMSKGIVHDMDENTAIMDGHFYSYNFRELEYAIDASTERIMGLNLTEKDNDIFFGKIYGKGTFHLNGTERKTILTADMTTDSGSDFNMPFSSVASVQQNKFISFVDSSIYMKPTEQERIRKNFFQKITRAKYTSEFDMSLTVHATPDVKCNIAYTNSVVSNQISGTGFGNLYLHYNPSKEIFTMDGGLDIEQGTYRLIFYIADKTFQLKKGSRIWWAGDPSNPLVDFTGIYQVHTSLSPLMGDSGYSASYAAIDCGIHMTESFFTPNITFEITAPNSTPETQSILRNALNTQEALSTQFFSLFLTNSFTEMSGSNSSMGNMGTSLVSTTGFEFLSNQISSLLSTPNFNWRPTYKPRTAQSSDEFGVQTQVNLMKNKVTLNFEGRYYVNPTYSNRQSPFSGGGDISINLNPSGNLKLKAFTRVIDRFDETQGLQESGAGIYFTQEFDNWQDLKRRINNYWENKRKKKEARKEERKLIRESIEKKNTVTSDSTLTTVVPKSDTDKLVIFATQPNEKH